MSFCPKRSSVGGLLSLGAVTENHRVRASNYCLDSKRVILFFPLPRAWPCKVLRPLFSIVSSLGLPSLWHLSGSWLSGFLALLKNQVPLTNLSTQNHEYFKKCKPECLLWNASTCNSSQINPVVLDCEMLEKMLYGWRSASASTCSWKIKMLIKQLLTGNSKEMLAKLPLG